jgi:hypothetical protein
MDFKFFGDVSSGGWGYALIWHMGGVYPYMGTPQRRGFFGGLKLITPYYCYFSKQKFNFHNDRKMLYTK